MLGPSRSSLRFGIHLGFLVLTCTAPLEGQSSLEPPMNDDERPIVLALTHKLEKGPDEKAFGSRKPIGFVFSYEGQLGVADVVLLENRTATPHGIRAAFRTLEIMRQKGSLVPGRILVVPNTPVPQAAIRNGEEYWGHLVSKLRRAPRVDLEYFGEVRWLILETGS